MLIPFDQLFARHNIKSKGCCHLGSSSGQERNAYYKLGIERVIWVEAIPAVFKELIGNINGYPGNIGLCACLSNLDGERVKFNVASNEGQSSSLLAFGTHSQEHPDTKFTSQIEMVTTRFDTLMKTTGIELGYGWFLNVDLQGAELLALRGMGDLLKHFDHAYIEVNEKELYKGCPLVGEIDDYMAKCGFVGKETKMTRHGWGDRYFKREPF